MNIMILRQGYLFWGGYFLDKFCNTFFLSFFFSRKEGLHSGAHILRRYWCLSKHFSDKWRATDSKSGAFLIKILERTVKYTNPAITFYLKNTTCCRCCRLCWIWWTCWRKNGSRDQKQFWKLIIFKMEKLKKSLRK